MEPERLSPSPEEVSRVLARLDRIRIKDLLLRCIVGINPGERKNKQDVILNITLFVDLSKAGTTDDIGDTVNYKTIKDRIVALVESSSFYLVERLAQAVADLCLDDSRIEAASVSVDKPGALRFARSVGVEILRFRPK